MKTVIDVCDLNGTYSRLKRLETEASIYMCVAARIWHVRHHVKWRVSQSRCVLDDIKLRFWQWKMVWV